MTCPNIRFAVSTLSQYIESPRTTHLIAVTRVFYYLLGTKELKLILGGIHSEISGYSDADWASHMHYHSISGFAYFLGIGAVNWSSKKQPIVTLSSTEAEYVVLTHASKDILWIHKLLTELSSIFPFMVPTFFIVATKARSISQRIQLSTDAPNTLMFISILSTKLSPLATLPCNTVLPIT